jgi:rhodanese-related sulfurtransferase
VQGVGQRPAAAGQVQDQLLQEERVALRPAHDLLAQRRRQPVRRRQPLQQRAVDPQTGAFLPAEQLRSLYEGQGLTPDLEVVAYCRIGERSAHSWFVLHELLGYPSVRNYDGSWTEWGSMVGVPIER